MAPCSVAAADPLSVGSAPPGHTDYTGYTRTFIRDPDGDNTIDNRYT